MAGIAALMSKRKRQALQKRQDTELLSMHAEDGNSLHEGHSLQHQAYTSFSKSFEHHHHNSQPNKFKGSQHSFKNATGTSSFGSKDWSQRSRQSQMETTPTHISRETRDTTKLEDGSYETIQGPSYSAIYIGLILVALGLVISFVGLGEKGFKTAELRLIGPLLCIVGFTCVTLKVIQCNFPRLFECSTYFKKTKKKVDQSTSIEKGLPNGNLKPSSSRSTPQILSPRVTLQSSKRSPRPRSTIPNYIEDSSDDDDFDPGRARPHTNKFSSYQQEQERQQQQFHEQPEEDIERQPQSSSSGHRQQKSEIVLNPKSLML